MTRPVVRQAERLCVDAMEALKELVACKDLKEKLERIEPPRMSPERNYRAEELREEYERRKEPAWEAARRAILRWEGK